MIYDKTLSRKTEAPALVDTKQAIKYKYFIDILLSFAKKGYDALYILEDGELLTIKTREGCPERDFCNAIIFVFKIDDKGRINILDMDFVPVFKSTL